MFLVSMSDQAGGFDDCQVELGRYQFLEDKEERKKRVRHLVVDCHDQSQQKQGKKNNGNRFSLVPTVLLSQAHNYSAGRHSVTSVINIFCGS